jgi:hypothetical protein
MMTYGMLEGYPKMEVLKIRVHKKADKIKSANDKLYRNVPVESSAYNLCGKIKTNIALISNSRKHT